MSFYTVRGGGGAIALLYATHPGSDQTSITATLSGLAVNHLLLQFCVSTSYAGYDYFTVKVNSDSDEHYSYMSYVYNGGTNALTTTSNGGYISIGFLYGNTANAYQLWSVGNFQIHNALSTSHPKVFAGIDQTYDAGGANALLLHGHGSYVNASAISTLTFAWTNGNIKAGSWIKIFGVQDA